MEYLLANIIFMFFHGLFISCLYASDRGGQKTRQIFVSESSNKK